MKLLKKNQIIIYIIALMLITAGYLNYTTNQENMLEASLQMESNDDTKLADIGDARLVNSEIIDEGDGTSKKNEMNGIEANRTNEANQTTEINTTSETNPETVTVQTNTQITDDYFTKSKLERDTMYSQMLETYEKVLNSSNSLETQKQMATQEITKINNTKNSIMICENLIKTKGFENNIIFVNENSISIIIGAQEIKQEQVAQIQNIISREMKAEIENIHISTK